MFSIAKVRSKYTSLSLGKRAAIWFVFCSFMQKGITFLTTPLFTRLLSTEQYGYWTLFQSWETVLTIVFTLNLTSGCYMQSLVKFDDRKDDLTSSFATLLTVLWAFFFVLFLAFPGVLSGATGLPARYIVAMFVSIWSNAMFLFWTVRQRVDLNYRPFVALSVAYSLIVSAAGMVCVVIAPEPLKADARIFSYAGTCLVLFIGLGVRHFVKGRKRISPATWGRAIRYNLPLIPHYLSQVLLNQFSRVQVNIYCGVAKAGIYGLAYSVGMAIQILNTSVLNVMTPWMYQKIKDGKLAEARRGFAPIFLVIFSACLFVVAISPEVVAFFAPPSYADASWVVPPVTLCVYFMFAQSIFDNYILYFEKTVFLSVASIVAAAANIALNAVAIPLFGFAAAGYSSLACFVLSSACHCIVSRRVLRARTGSCSEIPVAFVFGVGILMLACSGALIALRPYAFARYALAVVAIVSVCVVLLRMPGILGIGRGARGISDIISSPNAVGGVVRVCAQRVASLPGYLKVLLGCAVAVGAALLSLAASHGVLYAVFGLLGDGADGFSWRLNSGDLSLSLGLSQLLLAAIAILLAVIGAVYAWRSVQSAEKQLADLAKENRRRSGEVVLFDDFSDPVFRSFLREKHAKLFSHLAGDPAVRGFTERELEQVIVLNLRGKAIHCLEGVSVFHGLERIDCSETPLGELNVSGLASLESLVVENCVSLKRIDCSRCDELKRLSTVGSPVAFLNCSRTCLNIETMSCRLTVTELVCRETYGNGLPGMSDGMYIARINLDRYPNLRRLTCSDNEISTISATKVSPLEYLDVAGNTLTEKLPYACLPALRVLRASVYAGCDEAEMEHGIALSLPTCAEVRIMVSKNGKERHS